MPVIGFYVLYGLIGRVTEKWLLPLARPRAQEPGKYVCYLKSSGKHECAQIETKRISPKSPFSCVTTPNPLFFVTSPNPLLLFSYDVTHKEERGCATSN